jgi:hypothetical protein
MRTAEYTSLYLAERRDLPADFSEASACWSCSALSPSLATLSDDAVGGGFEVSSVAVSAAGVPSVALPVGLTGDLADDLAGASI